MHSEDAPTDDAHVLAQIREQVARFSKATEDEKAALAAPLRAFEMQYAGPVAEGQMSDALTEAYGLVATELGLWDKAHSAFALLAERDGPTLQAVRLRLAFVCRKQKRLEEAQALLDSIEGKTRDRQFYRNEVGRVRKALAARDNQDSALRARALLLAGDDAGAALQMRAALKGAGLDAAQDAVLTPVIDAALALYQGAPPRPQDRPVEPASSLPALRPDTRIVSLSGFGWSGSGAVADFLQGRVRVAFPFGGTELCCFEGFETCALGADTVLQAAESGDLADLRRRAAELILSAFLVVMPTSDKAKPSALDRWRRKSGLAHVLAHRTPLDGLTACCLAFLNDISRIPQAAAPARIQAEAETALQQLFNGFLSLVAGDGRVLVLNNCIHGYNIGLLRLLPGALGVVVHRDPRDAFVARHYENTRITRASAPAFVKRLKKHYARYHRQRDLQDIAGRIMDITFEDFLNDAKLRAGLLDRLGLEDADGSTGALRLEVSRGNIGIHADYPDQKALKKVAAVTFRRNG